MPDPVVAAAPAPVAAAPAPAPAPVAAAPAPAAPASPAPAPADPAAGYWPADWQQRMAGDDEKELKHIGKYASPDAIWKKARALEARLSSGELRTALPKDAKPEEIAQWRKDNGIPEAPDKYDLAGIDLKAPGLERATEFLKAAHAVNMTPEQTKAAIEWQRADTAARQEAQSVKDESERVAAVDALNVEWGKSFRQNINAIENFIQQFPESVRDLLKGGRLSDGTGIFNHPDILRGFVAAALQANPTPTLTPSGSGDPMQTALDEYRGIQKFMATNRGAYNKDAAKEARFRELIGYLSKQGVIDGNGNEVVQRKAA